MAQAPPPPHLVLLVWPPPPLPPLSEFEAYCLPRCPRQIRQQRARHVAACSQHEYLALHRCSRASSASGREGSPASRAPLLVFRVHSLLKGLNPPLGVPVNPQPGR